MEAGRLIERLTRLPGPRRSDGLVPCPLCGGSRFEVLGIRGNREHSGATRHEERHLWTNVARCATCDFVFANPPIAEAGDLEARHYATARSYETAERHDAVADMFRERLALVSRYRTSGTLLDVGAGRGEFVEEAARAGYVAEGVEPSRGLAEHAARSGLRVHHGELGSVDALRDARYDVISLNHVLEHVSAPVDMLANVRAHLAPGGVVFVEVPNVDAHLAQLTDLLFRLRGRTWSCRLAPVHPPFHSYGYTPRSLRYALEHAGLDVLEMTTRSGSDRGVGRHVTPWRRAVIGAAFATLSVLGNRELLLAVAAPSLPRGA